MNQNQINVRSIVRGAYDIQKLRIQMGNRIVAQFKAKLGQNPGKTEEEDIDDEGQTILADLRADYKKLMDGVKKVKQATFKATPLIHSFTEFALLQQYLELEETEKGHFKNIEKILADFPIWTEFLDGVKGIGPAMGGVIISEIDIHIARHPSSLWQYAGLGVEADGRGTSKRAEHLHDIQYKNSEGDDAIRKGIRFNPFLKTKLMGVLAGGFLKSNNPKYRKIYDDYKHRLENHPVWKDRIKGHRHNAALRYMVKQFLLDLYLVWRQLEGLEVSRPYAEAKLGHVHGASNS